LNLKR